MIRFPRLALLLLAAGPLGAATFTVTTTADSGAGSLRQAITDANSNVGSQTIQFAIPCPGVHTITPATPLPVLVLTKQWLASRRSLRVATFQTRTSWQPRLYSSAEARSIPATVTVASGPAT